MYLFTTHMFIFNYPVRNGTKKFKLRSLKIKYSVLLLYTYGELKCITTYKNNKTYSNYNFSVYRRLSILSPPSPYALNLASSSVWQRIKWNLILISLYLYSLLCTWLYNCCTCSRWRSNIVTIWSTLRYLPVWLT